MLVAKMTMESKDFENGLTNAKRSMNDFVGDTVKSFGKFMAVIKAAQVSLNTFKKIMSGTEQGADAMASAMYTAESVTKKFFQALGGGMNSMNSFIDGLDDIRKNAQEAYEAIDKLGTMKMWSNARMNQLRAEIAEQRVIVNSQNSTDQEKEAAKRIIKKNTELLLGLSQGLATQTTITAKAKLREISGAGKEISDAMLEKFVEWFEQGTLEEKAQAYRKQHAEYQTWTETVNSPGGWGAYTRTRENWAFSSKTSENIYNAMHSIATAVEQGGLQDYYNLLSEEAAMRTNVANQINKANNTIKESGGSGRSSGSGAVMTRTPVNLVPMLPPLQQMDEGLAIIEKINANIAKQQELEETNSIIIAVANAMYQQQINTLNNYASALGYVSNMFAVLSNIAADGSPWQKFASALSGVSSEITGLISTYTSLVAIESVARSIESGEGIPFPYNLVAIAAAGAALVGIISSLKGSFKDAGSFASGGIVGGNSYSGDRLIAHVNSGEMIIPYKDWRNGLGGGNVNFVIEGSQLKGVLDNYNKTEAL